MYYVYNYKILNIICLFDFVISSVCQTNPNPNQILLIFLKLKSNQNKINLSNRFDLIF